MNQPLRIALFTHSTLPRGGVAHALALGDALTDQGHDVVVHAPAGNDDFFRTSRCATHRIPVRENGNDLPSRVATTIEDCVNYVSKPARLAFDIYHAQDSITGNVLANLQEQGLIGGYLRTVHHLDDFQHPQLAAWQTRAVRRASRVMCVSRQWQALLHDNYGIDSAVVGNGVDNQHFRPQSEQHDALLRQRLDLGNGPIFLAVGGIEARKNSLAILAAFARLHTDQPQARLIIAGGASLLDHSAYRERFQQAWVESGLKTAVMVTGPLPQEDMPALYRLADALVFPSLKEGFGLAVLEAIACGTPVIVPSGPPFDEYLDDDCATRVNPENIQDIADGMAAAILPLSVAHQRAHWPTLLARYTWKASAQSHLTVYRDYLRESAHA